MKILFTILVLFTIQPLIYANIINKDGFEIELFSDNNTAKILNIAPSACIDGGILHIPSSFRHNLKKYQVISICSDAFNDLSNVTEVHLSSYPIDVVDAESTTQPSNKFYNRFAVLYVPNGCVEQYYSLGSPWSDFSLIADNNGIYKESYFQDNISNVVYKVNDNNAVETVPNNYNSPSYTIPSSIISPKTGKEYIVSGIGSVSFAEGVIESEYGLVWNQGGIEHISLPKDLKYIASEAFAFNSTLKSVSIMENVTNIGDKAFFECNNLEYVVNQSDTPQTISENTFSTYGTLYVKSESKELYSNAPYWNLFTIKELNDTESPRYNTQDSYFKTSTISATDNNIVNEGYQPIGVKSLGNSLIISKDFANEGIRELLIPIEILSVGETLNVYLYPNNSVVGKCTKKRNSKKEYIKLKLDKTYFNNVSLSLNKSSRVFTAPVSGCIYYR